MYQIWNETLNCVVVITDTLDSAQKWITFLRETNFHHKFTTIGF